MAHNKCTIKYARYNNHKIRLSNYVHITDEIKHQE